MNIAIQRGFYIGMSQNLRQGFYVKAGLNASCGKGMPEGMESYILQSAPVRDLAELKLHTTRLGVIPSLRSDDISAGHAKMNHIRLQKTG